MHVLTLEKLAKDGLLAGKRVLIRSDLNAPHDENGRITNETRLGGQRSRHPHRA